MGLETGTARRSLSDLVFQRMHRAIKSGAYQPDERLPTEHDLAIEFEVSRPVIREALRRLREQGFIYSRRGAGSFVRIVGMREPLGFGQLQNITDLLNCYEFRLNVEPAAAAAAAERHGEGDIAAIGQALELMRDATNRHSHRADADFQFHLAIARAAKNRYFSTAMEALEDHIAVGMKFHGASVQRDSAGLTRVFTEHDAITKAISERNPESARQLMREHLIGSRERLLYGT
ncbi:MULTISPECIES: FadR/GntR family transcriptional regulator [unclassified Rhizobium]|uniref:FadR/GntR family transcriptional regulator n=1 Tax=unclassified Rhizobium TaxID=2613769 RepID=UPI000BCCE279|nr:MULTISPECIES: FadR/GntR family transcriptional regulator [unclassified Rhizobium]MDH7809500.1 GntR family transcriptional repressor for pyruvate dehydrogenase complex [Rhizobium sp. AN67]MDQ4408749.1 FadR/GntR family transcriptional regulator [Rhizobium sp. AN63]SOD50413.1 regulatory protein, gntR family [Rhizobium sp. AN6A]